MAPNNGNSWFERHSDQLLALPLGAAATYASFLALNSALALAYFPVLWCTFELAIALVRRRRQGGALWYQFAFAGFFVLGIGLLAFVALGSAWP